MHRTPCRWLLPAALAMVAIAAVIGCVGVCAGLSLSLMADTPGGPSVVVVLAVVALASLLGRTLSGRTSA